jgi:hypothetical protein
MKIKPMTLILNSLLIFAWGFMLITNGLVYTLSFGFYVYICNKLYKPIKSYLPIIWTNLKEYVPYGWEQFFDAFRLWQSLMAEKKHTKFYKGVFFWFLSDKQWYLGDK